MLRFALTLSLFSVVATNMFAQGDVEVVTPKKARDSIRESYIKRFPDHFFIYPVLKQRSLSFEMERTDRSDLLQFRPNNTFNFGIGFYLFEFGADISFAIPLDEERRDLYGESSARDLQLNLLGKSWGIDLASQRYQGFYIIDRGNEPAAGQPFPQRPDIKTRNFGITGHYLFNGKKFSFRAVYNFSERQLYSRGSFLVFTSINSFRFSADRSILNPDQELTFGEEASFKYLRYTTFGIAPGYTYSLIFKNFFLNGMLCVGPAHHWIYSELEDQPGRDDIAINTFVAARIGIGYNGQRIFGGIGFYSKGNNVVYQNVEFSNNNGSFKVVVGYRFREWGVLKKRFWDIIPVKL